MPLQEMDEKYLFARKNNFCGYKYCPRCGSVLINKDIDSLPRLVCSDERCDYVYYHNPIPAAGALIIKDKRILMVKRAAPPKKGWWCFPAGFMEWGEHPSQTTVREVCEETGLEINLEGLFDVYSGNDDPRTNAVLILYVATVAGGKLAASDDAQEAEFFAFDRLPTNIAFESHRQALADYKKRYLNGGK
jgi:8-oxo-dGTP diphosphatase